MLTNVNGSDALVCVFAEEDIALDEAVRGFRALGTTFDDAYTVKQCELEFYLYEPLCLTPAQVARLRAAVQNG